MKLLMLSVLKKQSEKNLFIVPCLFTCLNACFGFLSLIYSFEEQYNTAAICIFLAIVMDMFDGRIARMLRVTTGFGMELDSLADVVSFGLAPVLLVYSWRFTHAGYFGLLPLALYLCAGILRLARFNITGSTYYFVGLPIPFAASCIASLVLQEASMPDGMAQVLLSQAVLYGIIMTLALLMVSSIPFPSFKSHKKFSLQLLLVTISYLMFIMLVGWYGYPILLLVAASYLLIGPWYEGKKR